MTYRSDLDALKAYAEEVTRALDETRARLRDFETLRDDEKRLAQELATVRRAIAKLEPKARSLLTEIRVASACPVDWNQMVGDDRVRYCGKCQKNVYNLSAMTAAEAEQLVRDREGDLCARFYRRSDGTMLTTDCPVGVQRKRRRLIAVGVAAGAIATGMYAASIRMYMGGVRPVHIQRPSDSHLERGDVVLEDPTPPTSEQK